MPTDTELECWQVQAPETPFPSHPLGPNGASAGPLPLGEAILVDRIRSIGPDTEAIDQQLPRVDGFALSFGVFQNYYSTHPPFLGNKNIPVIGTLATGAVYLCAPLMTPFVRRWPQWRRQMIFLGWALSILGLLAASFATSITVLIATQGVIYSIGFTIIYFPIISMLNEWFVARRGLAFGTINAATGVSGIAMPFVLAALLDKYGYPTTLRAIAVTLVVLTGPVLPMLKGRLPVAQFSARPRIDTSFLKKPLFYFFAASVLLQGLGYFYPTLFLPSYAHSLGYSPTIGALLLGLFSFMQVPGQIAVGHLSDKHLSAEMLAFVAPLVSTISILTLWGLARSLPPLLIFSLLYGFFGGGYVSLWAKMGMSVSDDPTVALVTFGVFCFLKGVGNVITGPISAALMLQKTSIEVYGLERYKWIISYSGICMMACTTTMGVLFVGRHVLRTA